MTRLILVSVSICAVLFVSLGVRESFSEIVFFFFLLQTAGDRGSERLWLMKYENLWAREDYSRPLHLNPPNSVHCLDERLSSNILDKKH